MHFRNEVMYSRHFKNEREREKGERKRKEGVARPPATRDGHSPDSEANARPLCASSQLRQLWPGAGEGWSARYRWPLSQKQPMRKRSPPTGHWVADRGARAHPSWETLPSRGKPRLPLWAVVRPEREGRAGEWRAPSRCPAPSAQCWLFSFLF